MKASAHRARFLFGLVAAAGLAVGAGSIVGSAAASHRAAAGLASQSATFPSWSPDGKQILFGYVGGTRNRIVRTSSRPGGTIRTVHQGFDPQFWAPGGRIVFGLTGWHSVGVRGGKAKPIGFDLPPCGAGQCWPDSCLSCSPDTFAILSPNREYAAVTTDAGAGNPPPSESIALLKLKPGRLPVEIQTPLNAEEQSGPVSDSILSFSPHGRQLVFRRDAADCAFTPCPTPTGPLGLMAFRLGSGAPPVPLAESGIPGELLVPSDAQRVQWSPDGRWVAFLENQSLEVVPTTGASAARVLPPCSAPGDFLKGFSWSPTSNLIAYDCLSNLVLDGAELMTVRPDGTHLKDLLSHRPLTYVNNSGGLPEPAQWSPDGTRLLFLAHAGAAAVGVSTEPVHVWTIRPNGHGLTRLG
jgi:WD40-like Beta Propeller Repeat